MLTKFASSSDSGSITVSASSRRIQPVRIIELACMRMGGGGQLDLNPPAFEEFLLRVAGTRTEKFISAGLGLAAQDQWPGRRRASLEPGS